MLKGRNEELKRVVLGGLCVVAEFLQNFDDCWISRYRHKLIRTHVSSDIDKSEGGKRT